MPATPIDQLKHEALRGLVRLDAALAEVAKPLPGITCPCCGRNLAAVDRILANRERAV